jgi:hypothetical protein
VDAFLEGLNGQAQVDLIGSLWIGELSADRRADNLQL